MERKVQKGWTIGTAVILPDADSTFRGSGDVVEERPLALSYMVRLILNHPCLDSWIADRFF